MKASHSLRVNGFNLIRLVSLLCSPPWLLMIFSTIQDVADPQTTKTMSFLEVAQPFQKCSNADRKSDLGVSSQGSSSMNTNFLSSVEVLRKRFNSLKASSQLFSFGTLAAPCSIRESRKLTSWFFEVVLAMPVC